MEKEMQAVYQNVIPAKGQLEINGKTYFLRLYTMGDIAYFENKYGISEFYKLFAEKPTLVYYEICWQLIVTNDKGEATEQLKDWPTLNAFMYGLTPTDEAKIKLIEVTMRAMGRCLAYVEAKEVQPVGANFREEAARKEVRLGQSGFFTKLLSRLFGRAAVGNDAASSADKTSGA